MALKDLVSGRSPLMSEGPDAERVVPEGATPDDVVRFLEEARRDVRLYSGRRLAVTALAPDRIGLVADLAERLSFQGLNVEGASQTFIGPFTVLSFVVSSPTVQSAEIVREHLLSSAKPAASSPAILVVALDPAVDTIPTSDYTSWVIKMDVEERVGVLNAIVKPIADVDGVLVRLASSVVEGDGGRRCTVDICFALPPDAEVGSVHRDISEALGPDVAVPTPSPAGTPASVSPGVGSIPIETEARSVAVIVGDARPGLIESVTARLVTLDVSILGSTMAILEGRTVAVFAVDVTEEKRVELEAALAEPADRFGLHIEWMQFPDGEVVVPPVPTHFFQMASPERPGQLAGAARTFASHGCNLAGVYSRVVGGTSPTSCNVGMLVSMPEGSAGAVEVALDRLSKSSGWYYFELLPYDPENPPNDLIY